MQYRMINESLVSRYQPGLVLPPNLTPFSFPLSRYVPVLAKDADPLTRHVLTLLPLSSCLSASEGCDSGAEKWGIRSTCSSLWLCPLLSCATHAL